MELAKVTGRGQITIPVEIRKKLNIKDGDKVVFIEQQGKVFIENAAMVALREVQEAFIGEAERAGLKDEQDIVDVVREVRTEMRNVRRAHLEVLAGKTNKVATVEEIHEAAANGWAGQR